MSLTAHPGHQPPHFSKNPRHPHRRLACVGFGKTREATRLAPGFIATGEVELCHVDVRRECRGDELFPGFPGASGFVTLVRRRNAGARGYLRSSLPHDESVALWRCTIRSLGLLALIGGTLSPLANASAAAFEDASHRDIAADFAREIDGWRSEQDFVVSGAGFDGARSGVLLHRSQPNVGDATEKKDVAEAPTRAPDAQNDAAVLQSASAAATPKPAVEAKAPVAEQDGVEQAAATQAGADERATGENPQANEPNRFPTGEDEEPEQARAKNNYTTYFEALPATDLEWASPWLSSDIKGPILAYRGGAWCVIEDAMCKSALIADADVGAGIQLVVYDQDYQYAFTQARARLGMTFRLPAVHDGPRKWSPWVLGVTGSYSWGSRAVYQAPADTGPNDAELENGSREVEPVQTLRLALMGQLWLSQRRHASHLDASIGAARSQVRASLGQYWGTHLELAYGFGGWGGIFASTDIFDRDLRVVLGMRGHGVAAVPIAGAVLLGLLAGGAL